MATSPTAPAASPPSYEAFLTSARALGAVINGTGIRFDRTGRTVTAAWRSPGKSTPPGVRFTTKAGPHAQPPERNSAAATGGGPFRGVLAPARIESPAPLTLRLETELDRTGKTMRINRETQTGDPEFDEKVYLESEAPDAVVLAALVDPSMRAGVLKCLALGCTSLLLDADGDLSVEVPLASEASTAPDGLSLVLDALCSTAEAVPPLQGKGRYHSLAAKVSPISVVGALVSVPLFFLVDWLWKPLESDLYWSAALGGIAIWIVTLPILFLFLRGRSTSLRDLLTSGIFLAFGLPLGAADALLTLNGLLDTAPAEVHTTRVSSRYRTTGKYSGNYVLLAPWHLGGETVKLNVGTLYDQLGTGQEVSVTTRRGFLGWERLTSIAPATAPQTSN
jgi:hypothetical protein